MQNLPVFDVELLQSVFGGDCLARLPDGRAVFVPYGLPGEKIRVELVEQKKAYARARLVEVLIPAAERIVPRCVHFASCGGCHYQHMPYSAQVQIKQAVVREQLERIAGLVNPPVAPVIPSPNEWNYRNTLQFHLDPEGKLGFQSAGSHQVVPVDCCHLSEPGLDEIWHQFEFEPLPGLERIEFRQGSDGEVLTILEGQPVDLPEVDVEMPVSLVHSSRAGEVVLAGQDYVQMQVLDRVFCVSAGSFFQVNLAQAGAMVQYLLDHLAVRHDQIFLDIYCGVGLFSAFFAPRVKELIGIELSESACDDFAVNLDVFENVSLYEGAAEDILPELGITPDVVLVDPPRSGLDVKALDALVALQPPVLAYISCDPSTLARDLKRLIKAGYQLKSVQPFDLFPQTYHVESICLLEKIQ